MERTEQSWPIAAMVDLPVRASRLDQVEIHQSILLHKALSGGACHDLSELAEGVPAFQDRCSTTAEPFGLTPTN